MNKMSIILENICSFLHKHYWLQFFSMIYTFLLIPNSFQFYWIWPNAKHQRLFSERAYRFRVLQRDEYFTYRLTNSAFINTHTLIHLYIFVLIFIFVSIQTFSWCMCYCHVSSHHPYIGSVRLVVINREQQLLWWR